jgi:hypothetical protein
MGEREGMRTVEQAGKQAKASSQKRQSPKLPHHSSLRSESFVHRHRTIAEKTQQLAQG